MQWAGTSWWSGMGGKSMETGRRNTVKADHQHWGRHYLNTISCLCQRFVANQIGPYRSTTCTQHIFGAKLFWGPWANKLHLPRSTKLFAEDNSAKKLSPGRGAPVQWSVLYLIYVIYVFPCFLLWVSSLSLQASKHHGSSAIACDPLAIFFTILHGFVISVHISNVQNPWDTPLYWLFEISWLISTSPGWLCMIPSQKSKDLKTLPAHRHHWLS